MQDNVISLRGHERLAVVIPALCRSRTGFRDHVTIHDISIGGCMIQSHSLTLYEGDLVVIRPDGLEGLAGRVRWTDRHCAGICFDQPLYGPVVEHLHHKHATFTDDWHVAASNAIRLAA